MKRTGSMGSRVGPAVTTTRRPERSRLPSSREAAVPISSGSASRPSPTSPSASTPGAGPDHVPAARHQGGQVLLHHRVLPHPRVHGGGEEHRAGDGQRGGGDRVVPHPGAQPGQQVGGGRGHHEQVGLPRQLQVAVAPLGLLVEQVDDHRRAADGLEGERPDEAGGGAGHGDADLAAPLHHQPGHLAGLVGGDASAHAEHHRPVREIHAAHRSRPGPGRPRAIMAPAVDPSRHPTERRPRRRRRRRPGSPGPAPAAARRAAAGPPARHPPALGHRRGLAAGRRAGDPGGAAAGDAAVGASAPGSSPAALLRLSRPPAGRALAGRRRRGGRHPGRGRAPVADQGGAPVAAGGGVRRGPGADEVGLEPGGADRAWSPSCRPSARSWRSAAGCSRRWPGGARRPAPWRSRRWSSRSSTSTRSASRACCCSGWRSAGWPGGPARSGRRWWPTPSTTARPCSGCCWRRRRPSPTRPRRWRRREAAALLVVGLALYAAGRPPRRRRWLPPAPPAASRFLVPRPLTTAGAAPSPSGTGPP